MKNLYFQSKTILNFDAPISGHQFLLRFIPPNFAGQAIVSASLKVSPSVDFTTSTDVFGNCVQTGSIDFPHDEFIYSVEGKAVIDATKKQNESVHPLFKFPSVFTKTDSRMCDFVESLNLSGGNLQKSLAIANAVYSHMTYTPFVTTTQTTAVEAFDLGKGVCQDYSHVFIALARFAGIPARYANGLQLGEGQSHAWIEIHDGNKWIGIDPTQNKLVSEDYIRFCVGRDFSDSALERGTFVGRAFQTGLATAKVVEI